MFKVGLAFLDWGFAYRPGILGFGSLFGFLLQLKCFFKKLSIVGAVPRPPWPPVSHPRALAKAFIYNINRVDAIHGALKSMVPISLIPLSGNLLSGERRAHRAHRLAARPA